MKFVPVEKIDADPSKLPTGAMVSVSSTFLEKAQLPLTPFTRMRCYIPSPDTPVSNVPVSLQQALETSKFLDVDFESRAPDHLRQALPESAFAFRFVTYAVPSVFNRAAQLLGAKPRFKALVDEEIYLVGTLDGTILRPRTGNFIAVDENAKVLRHEDLRPIGSATREEALMRLQAAPPRRPADEVPAFLQHQAS